MTEQNIKEQNRKTDLLMKEAPLKGEGTKSIREMSGHVTRPHLEPLPDVKPPEINLFPAPMMRSLGWGMLIGLMLGLIWAALLRNTVIVIPGWEGLYSIPPFTFLIFWAVIGVSIGGMVVGAARILRYREQTLEDRSEDHPNHMEKE